MYKWLKAGTAGFDLHQIASASDESVGQKSWYLRRGRSGRARVPQAWYGTQLVVGPTFPLKTTKPGWFARLSFCGAGSLGLVSIVDPECRFYRILVHASEALNPTG
jgi:hypothetical protein